MAKVKISETFTLKHQDGNNWAIVDDDGEEIAYDNIDATKENPKRSIKHGRIMGASMKMLNVLEDFLAEHSFKHGGIDKSPSKEMLERISSIIDEVNL